MNTRSFPVSFFKNKFDATPKVKYLTFREFIKFAEKPLIRKEKDGGLFGACLFEPEHRKKENVKIVSMAVFDIDHDGDFEAIKSAFEKLICTFLIITSHSHLRYVPATQKSRGNPNAEPRFRVIVPLATDISAEKFPQLWACIKQITNLPFDEGAKDASRMFYLPAIASADAPYTYYLNDSEFLEWEPLLENISDSIIEKAATKTPIQKPKNELEKGENEKTVNSSDDVLRTAQGWTLDFIADETREIGAQKLEAFLALDPKIKKTWEHKRKEFIDQSCSSYDYSLINFALQYDWTNQEIIDLLISHRKKYRADLKLWAIENYYARTLFNARNKNKKNKNQSFDNDEPRIENGRLVINANDQKLERITNLAWRALISANDPPSLFRFGDASCRIEMSDDGSPILRELNLVRTKHELARAAHWIKLKGKFQEKIDASPPNDVVADVLATKNMPLPVLDRLTTTPVYGRDGILQSEAGYNTRSRIYYHKTDDLIIPSVSLQPTNEDVKRAISFFDEMLFDFPFVSRSDKTHAIGLSILPFAREMILGATPLHAIESPSPGSGKGLLTNCLAIPSILNPMQITESQNDEEFRKKLTAALRNSPSFLVIDNAKQRIKSGEFASLLTATIWTDRIMGASEIVNLPVRCAFVLTANNPTYSQEIMRRTVRIRIDSKAERAWLRDGFQHNDLRSWAIENRGNLIWSALTLIQSWITAGKPLFTGKKLGSYERWSEVIGGILANAEISGFLENSFEFYEQADTEGDIWREFVEDWWFFYGSKPVRTGEIQLLQTSSEFYDERASTEHSQRVILGKQLAAARDRRFGNFKIERAGERQRAAYWRLMWIGEGEPPETRATVGFEAKGTSVLHDTHTH